jgi:RNA polymerase sigma-70 factor, ECF subfamily
MISSIESIWKEFHSKLRQFIVMRVSNPDDAEDILQEVFIRIYKNIDSLKDEQKLTSWIFQITRNVIIDYYRSKKDSKEFDDEIISTNIGEEDSIIKLSVGLNEFIEHLSPIYKEAIQLTEIEGLKQIELAEKLGISLTGAKSRVQRARQQLREMLLDCCNFEFDSAGKMCDFSKKMNCCENFHQLKKSTKPTSACTENSAGCS